MTYHIEGEKAFGEDIVLLHQDDDLTAHTHWSKEGYHINTFLPAQEYQKFSHGVYILFKRFLEKAGIFTNKDIILTDYHRLIESRYDVHLAVVNQAKLLQIDDFPIDVHILEERVSELCKLPVQALNPYNGDRVFHFRVIRPQSNDNNPLHRDVWLEEYHNCINIYVPICGSTPLSSLTLIPGSHQWSEFMIEKTVKGAKVNGIQFNVPAVTDSRRPLQIIRPNPKPNQMLVFSPYLLHGGATNLNEDMTRISLEMRFWRRKSQ